jgi:hypothetical protein
MDRIVWASLLCLVTVIAANPPFDGPYSVSHKSYNISILDESDPEGVIVYPSGNIPAGTKFPILSYAHGAAGGGWYTFEGYFALWRQIASHGFVVVATKSCSVGCKGKGNKGWKNFYLEQLKMFDWAKSMSEGPSPSHFGLIDFSLGKGIVGHSMGGQATVRSAAETYVKQYNIKAGVLHHPETDDGGAKMDVPIAAFTGTADKTCPPAETHHIWDPDTVLPKTLYNRVGADHLEPVLIPPIENPGLGMYTAAWFKIYLNGDTGMYHDLIYDNSGKSYEFALCKYYNTSECTNLLPKN